jgi:hypothetical protein
VYSVLSPQNIHEVASLLRQPGRRFLGEQGSHDAAVAIQVMPGLAVTKWDCVSHTTRGCASATACGRCNVLVNQVARD